MAMPPEFFNQKYISMIAIGKAAQARRYLKPLPEPPGEAPEAPRDRDARSKFHFDLNGRNIRKALKHVARFLCERNLHLDLIAIGPTCDTLRQRHESPNSPTSDYNIPEVEFLHVTHPSTTYEAIREAVAHAYRETGIDLKGPWIEHRYEHLNSYLAGRKLPMHAGKKFREWPVLFTAEGLTVLGWKYRY